MEQKVVDCLHNVDDMTEVMVMNERIVGCSTSQQE